MFEIPSNLVLERIVARKTFARITILWGLTSMAMLLVKTAGWFYFLRILLGAFEAGLLPGAVLYLTYWFPVRRSGCEANSSSPSSNSPIPVITGLEPNAAPLGGPAFTLTVQGTNFVAASLVTFDRTAVPTTFVSATHLTAAIPAAAIATAGTELKDVYVSNPLPGGRSVPFPIVMLGLSSNPGGVRAIAQQRSGVPRQYHVQPKSG